MSKAVISRIKTELQKKAPVLTEERRERMYKILNSSDPNFESYAVKVSEIEKTVNQVYRDLKPSYEDAIKICELLMRSNIQDEKFAGFLFLNKYKKQFKPQIISFFHDIFADYCNNWAVLDSCCIRVVGPYLAKHESLAKQVIESWASDDNLWVRRGSMVILLKGIMIRRDFEPEFVFNLVERMLQYPEDYIKKGVGWLLKTASKYKPDVIFTYLLKHKADLPRLVLRYASEKLLTAQRAQILKN